MASDSVSIFPRWAPAHRQCMQIGRETSGSDPALLRSAFYCAGLHFSFFPSCSCVCVLFFNWCNEQMWRCQERERRGGAAKKKKRTSSLLCTGRRLLALTANVSASVYTDHTYCTHCCFQYKIPSNGVVLHSCCLYFFVSCIIFSTLQTFLDIIALQLAIMPHWHYKEFFFQFSSFFSA